MKSSFIYYLNKLQIMKTFKFAGMSLLLIILLSPFTMLTESCKKTDTLKNQSAPDEFATETGRNANALPHTKQFDSEVATSWFTLLAHLSRTTPLIPAPSARVFAYSGMALYESVVPGMPSYQSIYKYITGDRIVHDNKKEYYWPACANAAIARIASRLLGNYFANPNLSAIQQLETDFNNKFQLLISPEQLQLSKDFGNYVADKIYDWSTTDGTLNPNGNLAICPPYVPLGGLGNWVPTPPNLFPAAGACQGSLRTFKPGIVNAALPPAPPAYSTNPTSDFYQMANEIYQISLNLTQDDINISQNWRDIVGTNYNGPSHATKIITEIIRKEQLNLEDASVIYAKQGIAVFDAIVAAFNAKFHYSLLRPVTYIRNVMGHTTWNSVYNTPQHPSYPAVAPSSVAASVVIWENTFGANYSFIDSTHNWLYGSWSYPSFDAMLQDVGRSRTHSGINFRIAVDAGITQGRTVGQMINQLPFKKE